jgi:hypothetical protein
MRWLRCHLLVVMVAAGLRRIEHCLIVVVAVTTPRVMGNPPSGPLAPDLCSRVSLGLTCAPSWILTVSHGFDLGSWEDLDGVYVPFPSLLLS